MTRPHSSLTNVIDFGPRTPVVLVSMANEVNQCRNQSAGTKAGVFCLLPPLNGST